MLKLEDCPFEGGVYGFRVGRLQVMEELPDFSAALPAAVQSWTAEGYGLVSCRISTAASDAAEPTLKACGFCKIETLVTFERNTAGLTSPLPQPEHAKLADVDDCTAIARHAFVHDRFHSDARLPAHKADQIKADWVRNSLLGRADASLVARDAGGKVIGFNLLLLRAGVAIIDLIAVSEEARGRGVGQYLVMAGLNHYSTRATIMRVGTQDANTPSMSLYLGCGFQPVSQAITWHWISQGLAQDNMARMSNN